MRRFLSTNCEFEPHSVIKVIKRNGNAFPQQSKKETKVSSEKIKESENQNNEMGIQMISRKLFKQIFGSTKPVEIEQEKIEK